MHWNWYDWTSEDVWYNCKIKWILMLQIYMSMENLTNDGTFYKKIWKDLNEKYIQWNLYKPNPKQKWTSNHIWFTCSNCGIVGDFNMKLNLDKSEHCCVENKCMLLIRNKHKRGTFSQFWIDYSLLATCIYFLHSNVQIYPNLISY
jgi:hypothetical protein